MQFSIHINLPRRCFFETLITVDWKTIYWDFRDALRRKSLCFFPAYFTNSQTKIKNAITLKRLKVET